jgi:hypothetical protein
MPFHTFADVNFVASLLFVFAASYALLAQAKVIEVKGANVLIALAIAFFSASFAPLAQFLQSVLPIAAILLVIAFFIIFGRNLLGKKAGDKVPVSVALATSLLLLAVLWNRIAPQLPFVTDPSSVMWILGIVIVLLIFYLVYMHMPG